MYITATFINSGPFGAFVFFKEIPLEYFSQLKINNIGQIIFIVDGEIYYV